MTLKILCAGENISSFQPLKSAFDKEDVLIITATSLALAIFLVRKNRPQLIISQSNLIDDTGLNLFYEIKNDVDLCHIPVAFLIEGEQDKSNILKSLEKSDNLYFFSPDSKWKNDVLKILD